MAERKRTFLTVQDRMKVIKLSGGGKSARSIATEFGVGKTQIQNVMKLKEEKLA